MRGFVITTILLGAAVGFAMPNRPASLSPGASAPPRPPAAKGQASGGETVLQRHANGHFYADGDINGTPVRFVVDTGATTVALTTDDARQAGVVFDPARFAVIGMGASGPVRGQKVTLSSVSVDGKRLYDVPAVVLEDLGVSLLGQSYLTRLYSVTMTGETMKLR